MCGRYRVPREAPRSRVVPHGRWQLRGGQPSRRFSRVYRRRAERNSAARGLTGRMYVSLAMSITLSKRHDLSVFCDKESSRYALSAVKYDSSGYVAATDGRIAAITAAPVNGISDTMIPMEAAKSLPKSGQAELDANDTSITITADGNKTIYAPIEGRFPQIRDIFGLADPKIKITLGLGVLAKLLSYGKSAGFDKLRLELTPDDNGHVQVRILAELLQGDDPAAPSTVVVMMPIHDPDGAEPISAVARRILAGPNNDRHGQKNIGHRRIGSRCPRSRVVPHGRANHAAE